MFFFFQYLGEFSHSDRLRDVVNERSDHRNGVMMVVFSFLLSFFPETSTEVDVKNCQCYCKNKLCSETICLLLVVPLKHFDFIFTKDH